jgi:glutathione S-transferase
VLNILIRSDDVAAYLAKKFGVPDSLVRDKVEREQLLQAAQQYQQQMAQGNAPDVQALRS